MARDLVVLLVVALPLLLWGSGATPLGDPDEGLYATIAREMVERGDWLTPRFNGLPYLEKPPLYYWLTALAYWLFGLSEWGARLWSALGALATVLLTAWLGREAFGGRVGLIGGLLCATSLGVVLYGRLAGVDLLFTALVTLSVLCFLRWTRTGGTAPRVGFYLAIGLAVLTKGALGLLLPTLVVGGFFLVTGSRPRLGELGLWWGVPLLLAVVVPWHLVTSLANPGFLSYYAVETHLVRFLRGTAAIEDEVPLSALGFLLVSLVWLLPWSLFLPSALVVLARRWRSMPGPERSGWTLVCLWAGAVVGLFSLSAFRLEHYGLPAFPALALLVAGLWSQARAGWLVGAPLALGGAGALLATVALQFGEAMTAARLGVWLAPFDVYFRMLLEEGSPLPIPPMETFRKLVQGMTLVLLLGFGVAAVALWKRSVRGAFGCLVVGTVVFLFLVRALNAEMAPYQSVKGVAKTIGRLAAPTDLVLYEGYLENAGGLPYYTGRQIHLLGPPRGDLAFGSRFPEARGLFHSPEELPRLWEGPGRVFLVTDRPPGRSAVRTLPPEGRHLLIRDHGRRLYSNQPGSGAVHQEPLVAGAAKDGAPILPLEGFDPAR
jgi:4-amino-4-deoxy-L-arabinose transferase-like glycosyltransferase